MIWFEERYVKYWVNLGIVEGCLVVSLSSEEYPIVDGENVMTSSSVCCLGHAFLQQRQICLQLVQYLRSLLEGGFQIGFRCIVGHIIRDRWWWSSIECLEWGCFDGRIVRRIVPKLGEV